MKNLKAKIDTLISQVEPMRYKIKNLRMIAAQHSKIGETQEANECINEAHQTEVNMEKAKKQIDTLMTQYEALKAEAKNAEEAKDTAA